jgi:SAM-dependent methyltransferase
LDIYIPHTEFLPSNGKIPLPDHSVDVVLALQVFHHVPPDRLEPLLKEIARVTVPGGYLLLREHDCRGVSSVKVIDAEHLIYEVVMEQKKYDPESYKGTVYRDRNSWENILRYVGFAPIKATPSKGINVVYNAIFRYL